MTTRIQIGNTNHTPLACDITAVAIPHDIDIMINS